MSEAPPVQKPGHHAAAVTAPAPPAPPDNRRWLILGLLALIVLLAIAAYFLVPDLYEKQTDDAYIDAHLVSVIPKVPAYVQTLHVNDNSKVTAGDLLVELDPRDYVVQVDQARANVAAAVGKLERRAIRSRWPTPISASSGRSLKWPEPMRTGEHQPRTVCNPCPMCARCRRSGSTRRSRPPTGHGPPLPRPRSRSTRHKRRRRLRAPRSKRRKLPSPRLNAMLEQATLNLSYTKIYATESGSVANKSVEHGNFVQPGQTLLSVVPDKLYVTANYKETQLTHVRPGQQVKVFVDAFPDLQLRGHVDSIQRGTGSHFALLPPENATGNFVKVVQRVPVKIELDNPGEALKLISPGMSVETEIFVRERPAWLGFWN